MISAVVATLAVIALGAFAYVTIAVNFEADRADAVVSAPGAGDDPAAFMRALGGSSGEQPRDGNEITVYYNGSQIFPPMLEAIDSARTSIHFSTFIFDGGQIPSRFAASFAAAAARNLEVRIILDRRGCKNIPRPMLTSMRGAGCRVEWFRGFHWYNWARYNHRNHRKLLIIDGDQAFTGGVGIADEWDGDADSPRHWRDTHVRVRGPGALMVQAAFVDSWNEATGELPVAKPYFQAPANAGSTVLCAIQSNPVNSTSAAQRSMAVLIAGATRRLWITNAYFIPTPPFVEALCAAAARGVDVKILLPGPWQDQKAVGRASRRTWPRLLAGGVELYLYQPTMIHAKTVVVDSVITSIGSINFDPRSFALNAEFGIVALDRALAAQFESAFAGDLKSAVQVSEADLKALSVIDRTLDLLCYWIRAQL